MAAAAVTAVAAVLIGVIAAVLHRGEQPSAAGGGPASSSAPSPHADGPPRTITLTPATNRTGSEASPSTAADSDVGTASQSSDPDATYTGRSVDPASANPGAPPITTGPTISSYRGADNANPLGPAASTLVLAPGSSVEPPPVPTISTFPTAPDPGNTVPRPPAAPSAAAFADPTAVSTAWLQNICYVNPAAGTVDSNVKAAAPFWTAKAQANLPLKWNFTDGWPLMTRDHITSGCLDITVLVDRTHPGIPPNLLGHAAVAAITGQQIFAINGKPIRRMTVTTTRLVVEQPGGRWLVDTELRAG